MSLLLISFFISIIVTFLVIKVTTKFDFVYKPQSNRWNQRVVSLHGGVGFGISFIILLIFMDFSKDTIFIISISFFMLLVGLIDDIKHLSPKQKLVINLLVSTISIYFGYKFNIFNNFFFDTILTFLWIIGITNAINMLDNMDGATTGISIISILSLILIGNNLSSDFINLAYMLSGVLFGFLIFNFNPAKIFMGDSGSLFLGTIISLLLLKYHQSINLDDTFLLIPFNLLLPALLIIVPIIDTGFVSLNRKLNGCPISRGDKGHTTHRLSYIFGNDKISVTILYLYQVIIASIVYFELFFLLYSMLVITLLVLIYLTKKTNNYVWSKKIQIISL